jgi:hypothetical protein
MSVIHVCVRPTLTTFHCATVVHTYSDVTFFTLQICWFFVRVPGPSVVIFYMLAFYELLIYLSTYLPLTYLPPFTLSKVDALSSDEVKF